MSKSRQPAFIRGMRDGIPIGLGYFAVAFSLGITARDCGFSALQGFVASITTYASAGQYIGFTLYAAEATLLQLIIMTIITNARYVLMGFALNQRLPENTPMSRRLLAGLCITEAIFGCADCLRTSLGTGNCTGHHGGQHPSGSDRQCAECRSVWNVSRGDHPGSTSRSNRGTGRRMQFCCQSCQPLCPLDKNSVGRQPNHPSNPDPVLRRSNPVPDQRYDPHEGGRRQ